MSQTRKSRSPNIIKSLNDRLINLETFINKKGIDIVVEIDIYGDKVFKLIRKEDSELIAYVTTSLNEYLVRTSSTRQHDELVELEAFCIKWIGIEDERYFGKGIGAFLLLYCLIYLINDNNSVKWVVLDDDSDRSSHIKTLYDGFGFEAVSLVELTDDGKHVKLDGPEKQLNIEVDFLPSLNSKINTVKKRINKKIKSRSRSLGGSKKTRKIK